MVQLLTAREWLKNLYSRYENFCRPALKFLLALISMMMINSKLGYSQALKSGAVTLIIALMCSFLPLNFIVTLSALIVLLQLYALSLESVIVAGVIMLVMMLLYFRFAAKDTVLIMLTPLSFILGVPYVIPLCAGLVAAPSSVVSTGCGVVVYYMLKAITVNRQTLLNMEEETLLEKLRFLADAIIGNREMMVCVAAFGITIIVVYVIRRLSVDHAWTIAIITGMLVDVMVVLMGDLRFETRINVASLVFGSLLALVVAEILQFFIFNVDYSRTEKVQFEDDEYYYYVKAVPKNTVTLSEPKVKKIKGQEKKPLPKKEEAAEEPVQPAEDKKDAPEYRVRRSTATRDKAMAELEEIRKTAAARNRRPAPGKKKRGNT
ncbi:MAG: hypothetical protein K6B44_11035 [Lachnospiraceae bacterium]|nr:hypothetical protein [Lachnospiraceae bacterium]